MPNLEWKATAIADLLAIIDYISDDNPDAAQVLKDEIEHKTSLLPERSQMYHANPFEVDPWGIILLEESGRGSRL